MQLTVQGRMLSAHGMIRSCCLKLSGTVCERILCTFKVEQLEKTLEENLLTDWRLPAVWIRLAFNVLFR
jgi:hypothetical protein